VKILDKERIERDRIVEKMHELSPTSGLKQDHVVCASLCKIKTTILLTVETIGMKEGTTAFVYIAVPNECKCLSEKRIEKSPREPFPVQNFTFYSSDSFHVKGSLS
jgi:hypothetical protein